MSFKTAPSTSRTVESVYLIREGRINLKNQTNTCHSAPHFAVSSIKTMLSHVMSLFSKQNILPVLLASLIVIISFIFDLENAFAKRTTPKKNDKITVSQEIIIDSSGREIHYSKPFNRIISLYGAHTENLFFMGLDDEIIGVSRKEAYPEAAKAKPWFSYHDGPEKFLGAEPDLVLVRPMIERGYPALVQRLEKSGIIVASLQPATVNEMYDYWLALGALTGKRQEAVSMVADFQNHIANFRRLTSHLNTDQKKQVYFEAIHTKMKTFTPGAMALFCLETAGGINVATDAISSRGTNIGNYGKEKILSHAFEIDVFLAQIGVMNHTSIDRIKKEPGFGILKAVRNNQIYLIDELIVSRPSYRLLLGIEIIGKILYPEQFGQWSEQKGLKNE